MAERVAKVGLRPEPQIRDVDALVEMLDDRMIEVHHPEHQGHEHQPDESRQLAAVG